MEIQFAPIQGYTDAAYRRIHNTIYPGSIACYYSPFIRIEKGDIRAKDVRDIALEQSNNIHLIPQIIANSPDEFNFLCDKIQAVGYNEIDVNVGCPFPLQTRKGRGAALLSNPEMFDNIMHCISQRKDIAFSIKMRLGLTHDDEWRLLIDSINNTPLRQVTIHPRIATQQYKGEINFPEFESFYSEISHPIVFNGDIKTLDDINNLAMKYPKLKGIMIGRGLLSRPCLAQEFQLNSTIDDNTLRQQVLTMHEALFAHYSAILQGQAQILTKIKTFWDYLEPLIGHKAAKAIHKSSTLPRYHAALQEI